MPVSLPRQQTARRRALAQIPRAPGVYLFLGAADEVLYVGKSVSLRDRVRSYFAGRPATGKLRRLRGEAGGLDWQVTDSEIAALLLESRLVKRYQPRYNALLRVFTPRPYLRLDTGDPFPRLEVTRAPAADGARYFGPFGGGEALQAAAEALSDTLGLRTCDRPGERLPGSEPCYRLELGLCLGPCVRPEGEAAYRSAVQRAANAARGRDGEALRALTRRMRRSAARLDFERAAELRDAIAQLRAGGGGGAALRSAVGGRVAFIACVGEAERLCLLTLARGRLAQFKEVPLASLAVPAERAQLAEELASQELTAREPVAELPEELLDEVQIVSAWLRQRRQPVPPLEVAAAGSPDTRRARLERWLEQAARASARSPARAA